jgi:AraC-like DNA-binding protein
MEQRSSELGATYERFFENGRPNPAGDVLNAGWGIPERRMNWWDTRSLWSCSHYSMITVLESASGFYQNENGFHCKLAFGDVCFVFPHFKQFYGPGRDQYWSELFTAFAGEIFEIAERQAALRRDAPVWRPSDPTKHIAKLQTLLQSTPPASQSAKFRRAVTFLDFIIEMLEGARPVEGHTEGGDWFAKACEMIVADIHHKADWTEIADALGMSYHTFRLYFKRRAGVTPAQYRAQQRIERACTLLVDMPTRSCSEIAFILGYASIHHFSEQFKKSMGIGPHEFRKTHLSPRE